MSFFINQLADVGSRITWTEKKHRRFLMEIKHLIDFEGEINNNWGMYALYIHSNGRSMKEFIERLAENNINIDSSDRNIIAFPNPFQFNTIFNGDRYSVQPVIQKKFKDIKYLKLETISLPDQYSITKEALSLDTEYTTIHSYYSINYSFVKLNDVNSITIPNTPPETITIRVVSIYISGTNWTINYIINDDPSTVFEMNQGTLYNQYFINQNKKISDDRMFYVYIPEITSRNYTTSQQNVTFTVTSAGTNPNSYTLLNEIYPSFLFYKDSMLEKANKYTVKITDRFGNVYVVNNLDSNANLDECNCSNTIDYSCRCSYIRNPYYVKLQVSLQFKFGLFEDDLFKDLINVSGR